MRTWLFAFALLLTPIAWAREPATDQIAITFDDLPWATLPAAARPDLPVYHGKLMAALKSLDTPVLGFVNEGKLEVDGAADPARVELLNDWLRSGESLGNHTYGHLSLHAVGLAEYQADILRGERIIRALLAADGQSPQWFRHPYLRAGQTREDKQALQVFLAEHGYRIAPVSVDNSDWIWARAYRNLLDRGDAERELARVRRDYVPYLIDKLTYYEQQSRKFFGRNIAHVLLLHANELNADTLKTLLGALDRRGYRLVTLDQALKDPIYRREDGYFGAYGPSWIHRYALAAGFKGDDFAGEPASPPWILDLAGVESE